MMVTSLSGMVFIDRHRDGLHGVHGAPASVPHASKDPDFGQAPPAIRVSRRLAE